MVQELIYEIQMHLGILVSMQSLIDSRQIMSDNHTLQHYGIASDSTIILNLQLWGGCSETISKGTGSFKDVVKGEDEAQTKPAPPLELPGP